MSSELANYMLTLYGPAPKSFPAGSRSLTVGAIGIATETLKELEENVSDLLPNDYFVKITGPVSENGHK